MSNEFDYTKLKHVTSVDQSDREVPYNLRQSGPTKVEMLISTRVRKSPYWHLSMQAGCWRATVYNRIYHPRGYVKPEDGGAMVEYEAIKNHVTMWNVAVERQIRVKGPDAEKFTDYVITRDATKISPMRARYVILCNAYGGVLNSVFWHLTLVLFHLLKLSCPSPVDPLLKLFSFYIKFSATHL